MFWLIVEDRIEKLKNELLLFARQRLHPLELSLELGCRAGLAFRGVRLAAQEFGDRDFESGGGQLYEIKL